MAYCYNCGSKIYLIDKVGKVDYVICEDCGHEITVCDYGTASPEKIEHAREEFQKKYENNVKGLEPVEETIKRISVSIYNLKENKFSK